MFKGSLPNAISDRNSPGQLFGSAQKAAADESSCNGLMETLNCPSFCNIFLHLTSCVFKSIIYILYHLCVTMPLFGWEVTQYQDCVSFSIPDRMKGKQTGHVNEDSCIHKILKMIHILEVSTLQSSRVGRKSVAFFSYCLLPSDIRCKIQLREVTLC